MGDNSKSSSNADESDWRTQLTLSMRLTATKQIFQELMMRVPNSEKIKKILRIFAVRFEDMINGAAFSLEDYYEKTYILAPHAVTKFRNETNNNSVVIEKTAGSIGSKRQPDADERKHIIEDIDETMKKYIPSSSEEISLQSWCNAVQFEHNILLKAASKWDYFHKISAKMLMMEETFRNTVPSEDTVSDVFKLLLDL